VSRRLEINFQIDEEDLIAAMTDIRQAFSQFDSSTDAFEEVNRLLDKLTNTQNRFPVEPGYEEDDDE
jgi:hypothetical protein